MTRRMPAETELHERTWMAFPAPGYVLGSDESHTLEAVRTWSGVANAISAYEPVSMLVTPSMRHVADDNLDSSITLHECPLDDSWMRDIGPTFVVEEPNPSERAQSSAAVQRNPVLKAVNWVFNGWGAQDWATWGNDSLVAGEVARIAGMPRLDSAITLEGGGFHVDGRGTAILTETVALDPGRNPKATKETIEQELADMLGVTATIWLPRGLTRDYGAFGTRGHVDIVACMPEPGTVLVHEQRDRAHPDYDVSKTAMRVLAQARDAQGKQLEVIPVPAPAGGFNADSTPNDYSYINHYVANGAVFACVFDDANDEAAMDILAHAYPGRDIVPINALALFARGGGIHCITQQQPLVPQASETVASSQSPDCPVELTDTTD